MKLFDSHCHLDDRGYENDLDEVIARARAAGVKKMMTVGINLTGSERSVALAESCPGVYASVGIHPHDAKTCSEPALRRLQSLARHPKVRAWGEIGLDYNRMHSPMADQEKWFMRQLDIAHAMGLPLIFHERDSNGRFLEILKSHAGRPLRGVVHCFTGNAEELDQYIRLGLYIGITGILTIKGRGARLRELVSRIPVSQLLVETDAPFLTPTPERNRARRNEPAFVATVLLKLAEVRGEDPDLLSEAIWENTCRLFGIEG
jgi:TatD DNase family protein